LPVLLFGLLFLLPPGVAMLPSWLAGRPPLVVVPEEALAVAAGELAEAAPPAAGAVVPPEEGAPEASAAGTPPLKPLLPPAGLSPADGVRAASVPLDADGVAPEPVLPGVLPVSSAPFLPQALKARARARTASVQLGRWRVANGGMGIFFL
jgi:hypothetical protein